MNVLMVSEYYYPYVGGADLVTQRIAEGVVSRGHNVTVVTVRLAGTKTYEELNGVHVHRVNCPKLADRYFFTLFAAPRIYQLAGNTDVIHTRTYNAAPPAWLCAKLLHKPSAVTVHEVLGRRWFAVEGNGGRAWFHLLAERLILKLPFDVYACVSRATQRDLENGGIGSHKTVLVYLGVDDELFKPRCMTKRDIRSRLGLSKDNFLYLYFGRPGVTKGIEYLVQAIPEIAARVSGSKALLILGKEPAAMYKRLVQQIDALIMNEQVIIFDPVKRDLLPDYVAAADCVVVPSLTEGFGLTAAEACAVGVPVVATTAGSLPEVVSGKHVLVEPGSASAIADGVYRVYKKEFSVSPHKAFSWDRTVDEYLAIYKRLIKSNGCGIGATSVASGKT